MIPSVVTASGSRPPFCFCPYPWALTPPPGHQWSRGCWWTLTLHPQALLSIFTFNSHRQPKGTTSNVENWSPSKGIYYAHQWLYRSHHPNISLGIVTTPASPSDRMSNLLPHYFLFLLFPLVSFSPSHPSYDCLGSDLQLRLAPGLLRLPPNCSPWLL